MPVAVLTDAERDLVVRALHKMAAEQADRAATYHSLDMRKVAQRTSDDCASLAERLAGAR